MSGYELILGDAQEYIKSLPGGSVDAVVTDPPYGTGNWKRAESGAGSNPHAIYERHEWDEWKAEVLLEALRVARLSVIMFAPQPRIAEVIRVAEAHGRSWRLLFWAKTDPRPRFSGQPAYAYEGIIAIGKLEPVGGGDYYLASAPRLNRDNEATGHPHQKPLKVMRWLCQLAAPESGTILDPYAGSGSTGVAALETGHSFIGCEIDEAYYKTAKRRLEAVIAQPQLEFA